MENKFSKIVNQNIKLFIVYVFFAGIATIVDLGFLYMLTEFLGIYYFYSAIFAYMGGISTNYCLNKFFNFKNRNKKILKQFGLFIFVALIGLIMNQLIILYLVEVLNMWYMLAKMISTLVVMFWSFYGHKKVTFEIFK